MILTSNSKFRRRFRLALLVSWAALVVLALSSIAEEGESQPRGARLSTAATQTSGTFAGETYEVELTEWLGAEEILQVAAVTPVALVPFPGEALSGLPADLGTESLYGTLRHGGPDGIISMLVDPRPDGTERIYVDQNDDEDLSNDPPLSWQGEYAVGSLGQAILPGMVVICELTCEDGQSVPLHVKLRRFDRQRVKGRTTITVRNGILASVDTYRRGSLQVGEVELELALLPTVLAGQHTLFAHPANALVVDLNQDGKLDGQPMRSAERFRLGSPFRFGGRAFKVTRTSCDGFHLTIAEIDPRLATPQRRRRAGLVLGEPVPVFELTTIDGQSLNLESYRGKVVLLDFWATWCGPCRFEMPNVKAAYARYHEQGFEIIGISLDTNPEVVHRYTSAKEMPWPQILQPRGQMTPLKLNYGVSAIPAAFLIGPDGELLATGLRGARLGQAVEKALAGKLDRSD